MILKVNQMCLVHVHIIYQCDYKNPNAMSPKKTFSLTKCKKMTEKIFANCFFIESS